MVGEWAEKMWAHLNTYINAGEFLRTGRRSVARFRPAHAIVLALILGLGACAAPPTPVVPPTVPPAPVWTTAIGHLTIEGQRLGCTAVLVKPDVIATVSHCLYPNGVEVPPEILLFTPSGSEMAPSYRGVAVLGTGGAVTPGVISENQASHDWALIRIEADQSVWPVPLAPLSAAQVRADLNNGAEFYSAGYGSGSKTKLSQHKNCGPLPADPTGITEGEDFFATNCIVRLGDSGGPVVLVENGAPRLIGLIVGFAAHPKTREPIAVIVSTKAFAPYISGPLIGEARRINQMLLARR